MGRGSAPHRTLQGLAVPRCGMQKGSAFPHGVAAQTGTASWSCPALRARRRGLLQSLTLQAALDKFFQRGPRNENVNAQAD
jgi:hypothetical protein